MAIFRVKICGITSVEDARRAVAAGADALGLVFAPSPRRVSPEAAEEIVASLPPSAAAVGVFVDERPAVVRAIAARCRLAWIQFHGDEEPEECLEFGARAIKAVRVRDAGSLCGLDRYRVGAFLLDSYTGGTHGGTGRAFRWELAASFSPGVPVVLSGGLTPENVARAIAAVKPQAVDASSGVESSPGRKDPARVAEFVRRARAAFEGGGAE